MLFSVSYQHRADIQSVDFNLNNLEIVTCLYALNHCTNILQRKCGCYMYD